MNAYLTFRRWATVNSAMFALLVVAASFALLYGSADIGVMDAFRADGLAREILFSARLPRVVMAALVGMALATSGGAFQAILRNPLADPFIIGVSGGAALGSVAAVGLKLPFQMVATFAFAGSIISMLCIFWIATNRGRFRATELLLTGVIFNAFCFALILFINAMVTMEEAYQILFLLIGNLEDAGAHLIATVGAFVLTGFVALTLLSRRMNLLLIGDAEARSMGINLNTLRIAVFFFASLMVGAAVAAAGLIGFVGLFVPHMVRLVFGADQRVVIPASGLFGAAFLVLADALARTVLMGSGYATELPVGVITAMVGAPLFLFLLKKRGGRAML